MTRRHESMQSHFRQLKPNRKQPLQFITPKRWNLGPYYPLEFKNYYYHVMPIRSHRCYILPNIFTLWTSFEIISNVNSTLRPWVSWGLLVIPGTVNQYRINTLNTCQKKRKGKTLKQTKLIIDIHMNNNLHSKYLLGGTITLQKRKKKNCVELAIKMFKKSCYTDLFKFPETFALKISPAADMKLNFLAVEILSM